MALQNWHEIGLIAQDVRARSYCRPNYAYSMPRKRNHRARPPRELHLKKLVLTLTVVFLFSVMSLYSANVRTIPNSAAHQSPSPKAPTPLVTSSGPLVYTNPVNVSVASVGTTFTVQVVVLNMPGFDGWDIRVWAAPWIINATSLSITGNDFQVNASSGTAFEIIHCINGAGTGCAANDTAGWVHSSYGNTGVVSGNGLLFTITYKVVGNAASSKVWFGYTPILLQVSIASPSSANGVPTGVLNGNYGTFQLLGSGGGGSIARRD